LVVAPHQIACIVTELMVKPERPVGTVFHHSFSLPSSYATFVSAQVPRLVSFQLPVLAVPAETMATLSPAPQTGETVTVGVGKAQAPRLGRANCLR
jgi:deferrochelatase/peroxidase EfeB